MTTQDSSKLLSRPRAILQLIIFSIIGLVMFFVPFTINGKSTILFDHAANYLVKQQRTVAIILLFMLMLYGAFKPFATGKWKQSVTDIVLSFAKLIGLILAILYVTGFAPSFIMTPDMMPFLFEKLALMVGMIIPLGAIILAFLIGFGLLEMIGVLMQPIMKPLWRTPGSSAIDAVASFVGSYSIGLLITNRVFMQKKYTEREAIIIATGFSTVSAAFMVVVAKTLDLMSAWNFFFWSTLLITFLVTAIVARIPPISLESDAGSLRDEPLRDKNRLSSAIEVGIETSRRASNTGHIIWSNFRDGLEMSATVVPSIIAVGLAGLLLDKYTPTFDILGLLLLPFTWIAGLAEPLVAAKGMSAGLAEMFLPAILLKSTDAVTTDILTRYVAGVVSISSIIFFSALIPCVLATKIPLSIPKMLIIWFERSVFSILLAAGIGHLAIALGWLV